jgi:alanyl-tRNA synthetase
MQVCVLPATHTSPQHHASPLTILISIKVLGTSAAQAGSSVDDKSLRFDFTYPSQVLPEQLAALEQWVR